MTPLCKNTIQQSLELFITVSFLAYCWKKTLPVVMGLCLCQ